MIIGVIVTIRRRGLRYRTLPVSSILEIILLYSLVLFGIIHFQLVYTKKTNTSTILVLMEEANNYCWLFITPKIQTFWLL